MQDWPPSSAAFDSRSPQRYSLQGGGPPASCDELEHRALLALEVVILWRGDVLAVCHRLAPCSVFVGEASSCCDLALPAELLGAERLCVAVGSSSEVSALLPAHASGWLTLPDGSTRAFESSSAGRLGAARASSSERSLPLERGQRAHLCFEDIEIQVAAVAAGRAPVRRRSLGFEPATLAYFALSSLSVGGLLAALSLLAPPLGLNQDESAAADRIYVLQEYLSASAERVSPPPEGARAEPMQAAAARRASSLPSPPDEPARSEDGAVTDERARDDAPAPAETSQLEPRERRSQLEQARGFGMVALLGEHLAELDDPGLRFQRQLSSAELGLMQQMFLDGDGLSGEGPGGLALSGTGLRGGGKANAIALGALRTLNEGQGGGLERLADVSHPTGSHRVQTPLLRPAETSASDQLPLALVRRTVNRSFAKLRGCYEAALPAEPEPAVDTIVHFVVQPDGHVDYVRFSGATQAPEAVLECIEKVFYGLSFPRPGTSPASVTYPVRLSP